MHRDHSPHEAAGGDSAIPITERENESTTVALLRAVAAMKGVPEHDLGPLYETIEPTALERMMAHSKGHDRDVAVEFTYEGVRRPRA